MHRAMENNNKNSWDLAILFIKRGSIYIHINITLVISTNHFNIDMLSIDNNSHQVHKDDINISIIAATISWTIRNHIAIFPYNELLSHLSDINFIIIIVLLNVSAIHIYRDSILLNHKNFDIKNHIIEVKKTCHNQVINDAFQVSFIIFAFNHIHTMKSSRDIHIWEKVSNISELCKKFKKYGHKKIPDNIYHIISGCFNNLTI